MSGAELVVLTTTFPDRESAERVAAHLVDSGLAVCAQVGADLLSFYRWQGQLRRDPEVAVVLKVLAARLELCAGELEQQHPDDVPQIVAWPAGFVGQGYLDWAKGKSE